MAANSVVQFVVGKLRDMLIQEIIFLKGVLQQFERLKKELVSITGFLETADAKHSNDPDICIWVSDVRDIAYDVDDVIDAFFLKCVSREKGSNVLCGIIGWLEKIIDEYNIVKEIEAIFSRIDDISRRRHTFGITSMPERGETSDSTVNNEVCLRRSYAYATDEDVVGLNIRYQDFKLVKVLEVVGIRFGDEQSVELSNIIGKLTNLRYLRLRETFVDLNESIGNLVCLQTLDLRGSYVSLPNVIWKMRQLRHLHLSRYGSESSSLRMNTLTKLQTLCDIYAGGWIADLEHLRNLNKLGIRELTEIQGEKVIDIIVDRLDNLVSLSLDMAPREGFPNLKKLFQKQNLISLTLGGKMQSSPSTWPPNITKLILMMSKLKQDPMPTLQMLPKLAHLILDYAYDGKEMVCSENGFPQLRYIEINTLLNLEEWRVEKGAMPCLTTCKIICCISLKMVPQGFEFVTTLQNLSLIDMKRKFNERVREGKDWDVVKNIPFLTVKNH